MDDALELLLLLLGLASGATTSNDPGRGGATTSDDPGRGGKPIGG